MSKNALSSNSLEFGLVEISKELRQKNIEFFAFFGTLLGLVRETKPISGDDDIDFYVNIMHHEDVKTVLADLKFKINYSTKPNHSKHFIQATGLFKGTFVAVDFYFYDTDVDPNYLIEKWNFIGQPENPDCILKIPKPLIFPLDKILFRKVNIPAPKYPEVICEFLYGVNWTSPQIKGVDYTTRVLGGRPIRLHQTGGTINLLP